MVKDKGIVTLRDHVRDSSSLGLPSLNSAYITGIIDTQLEIIKKRGKGWVGQLIGSAEAQASHQCAKGR